MSRTLPLSAEQQRAVDAVRSGSPIVQIDAIAGAGKSTLVLGLAAALPHKALLQLTYNSALRHEVREKVLAQGLGDTLAVHTYHSLACKFYENTAYTDERIYRLVYGCAEPIRQIPFVDILIIDEIQDMSPLYYGLVQRLLLDLPNRRPPQLLLLGDVFQSLYGFKGADTRFLSFGHMVFNRQWLLGTQSTQIVSGMPTSEPPPPPASFELHTSYRVTIPIAHFVNTYMLGGTERMIAHKEGPPVLYIRMFPGPATIQVYRIIKAAINSGKYSPSDIFILAPSIKHYENPIRLLENQLILGGIPCFMPISDEGGLDNDVIQGKVVITTFHQSKGRERPLTVVFGFDASYFKYYERVRSPLECPPTLYVACTRASRELIVVEDIRNGPLPFLDPVVIGKDANVHIYPYKDIKVRRNGEGDGDSEGDDIGSELSIASISSSDREITPNDGAESSTYESVSSDGDSDSDSDIGDGEFDHRTSVSELIKFLGTEYLSRIADKFPQMFRCLSPPDPLRSVTLPAKVQTGPEQYEEVADLTGNAIVAMWEHAQLGTCTLDQIVRSYNTTERDPYMDALLEKLPNTYTSPSDFLYLANVYHCFRRGIYFKTAQIQSYDWLSDSATAKCFKTLKSSIGDEPITEYERELKHEQDEPFIYNSKRFGRILICGIVDAVSTTTVYEFKVVSALSVETHFLQVILYAWIWSKTMTKTHGLRRFKLLNIRTSEEWELIATPKQLKDVATMMLENRYKRAVSLNDAAFLTQCRDISARARKP